MIGLFLLGAGVFFCGYVAGRIQAQAKCDKVLLRRGVQGNG